MRQTIVAGATLIAGASAATLFRNNGSGTFTDATNQAGAAVPRQGFEYLQPPLMLRNESTSLGTTTCADVS